MDTNAKPKKREWIKNAAIILLAVLLGLTFFSNTILNSSLPEVATREIASGTVTARIRVSGTVAANQSYEVSVNESRRVRSVMVKQGQEVQAGDVLFVLSDGESEELEMAEGTLRDLQKSYQEKLINAAEKDYARENREIQNARNAIAEAERERDALVFDDTKLVSALNLLEQRKRETEEAQARVDAAKRDVEYAKAGADAAKRNLDPLNEAVERAKANVSDAQAEVTRLERELRDAESGRDRSSKATGERGTPSQTLINARNEAQREYSDAQDRLLECQNALAAAHLAYDPDWNALAREALRSIYLDKHRGEEPPDWDAYTEADYDLLALEYASMLDYYMENIAQELEASHVWRAAYDKIKAAETEVQNAETALSEAKQRLDAANADVREAYNSGTYVPAETYEGHNYDWWDRECQRIERLVRSAEADVDSAQRDQALAEQRVREYETTHTRAQDAVSDAQERLSEAQDELSEYKARESDADNEVRTEEDRRETWENDRKAAEEKVRQAEKTLGDLLADLQDQQRDDDRQSQLDNIELQDLASQVARQQAKVNELREDAAEQEVTAPVSGVVQSLGITAGQTTTPKSAMAVLELPDMGYALNASVSNEQARRVHVGDSASVANVYWGTEINATLTAIRPDPKDPQNQKQLSFELTGDVSPGAKLTLSVGQRSAEYDFVVPNSALRSDSNGDFILVVVTKSSPLGNRYEAVRTNVTKLASDDTSTAVSGALNAGDFVITTSTAPIKNGDRVRLADVQTGG